MKKLLKNQESGEEQEHLKSLISIYGSCRRLLIENNLLNRRRFRSRYFLSLRSSIYSYMLHFVRDISSYDSEMAHKSSYDPEKINHQVRDSAPFGHFTRTKIYVL